MFAHSRVPLGGAAAGAAREWSRKRLATRALDARAALRSRLRDERFATDRHALRRGRVGGYAGALTREYLDSAERLDVGNAGQEAR